MAVSLMGLSALPTSPLIQVRFPAKNGASAHLRPHRMSHLLIAENIRYYREIVQCCYPQVTSKTNLHH